MLTQICRYLKNWFDEDSAHSRLPSWSGEITISGGELVGFSERLKEGQYFRVLDSAKNNGVHLYPASDLKDEIFSGTVQSMNVDPELAELAEEIAAWMAKYAAAAASPFQSETTPVYSYAKGYTGGSSNVISWQSQFKARLAPWRKL